ncbi:hypothetical protein T484DRAFT_1788871, partial [Baffinella frigidus]
SAWGNYIPVLAPIAHETKIQKVDNYVAIVKPLGRAADFSPAAPGALAVGAEDAFQPFSETKTKPPHGAVPKGTPGFQWGEAFGSESRAERRADEDIARRVDLPGAEYPRGYAVVEVSAGGAAMRVAVPSKDGAFEPATVGVPRRVEVERADGSRVEIPYSSFEVIPQPKVAGEVSGVTLELIAEAGAAFPPDAIEASPAAEFLVAGVSDDGAEMVVAAPNSGIFSQCSANQGTCAIKLRFSDGVEIQMLAAGVEEDGEGIRLIAAPGTVFPADVATVGPAAVVNASPKLGATMAKPSFPVVGATSSPSQLAISVSSLASFAPGPGTMTVTDLDGTTHADVPYESVSRAATHASGQMVLLVNAPQGVKYPTFPSRVTPDAASRPLRERAPTSGEALWFTVAEMQRGTLRVRAPIDAFPPGPGTVLVSEPGRAPVHVRYATAAPPAPEDRSEEDAEEVLLVAASGEVFPPGAEGVSPLLKRVVSVREDGAVMQILAPNDGSFTPGPSPLTLQLPDGSTLITSYAASAALPASSEAGGMLLFGPPKTFPVDAAFALPTGPRMFAVSGVSKDGTEVRVAAVDNGAFAPGPAAVSLIFAGTTLPQKMVAYTSMVSVSASGNMPAGLVLRGDFSHTGMAAVVGVIPLGADSSDKELIGDDVMCAGSPVRATGILTPHAPLYSDASEPTFTSLPKTLQGLEYLRTPGEAPSASGPSSWCDVRLREAADVFLLLPALSGNTAASPIPVAKVDGSRSSLTVILPARSLAPGPLLPAGPWALTAFSPSENAHVAVSYASVEVLGQDGDGAGGKEGASSGKEEGGSVEGVEVRITAAEGQMFPTDAQ